MFFNFYYNIIYLYAGILATITTSIIYFGFVWKPNYITDLSKEYADYFSKSKKRKIGNIPPIYPNGWFALLESRELKIGEVKYVVALGENFAIFRTEKGKACVMDAYCPHLGANMAFGGEVVGDCLRCPFHSWHFDGNTGICTKIPYEVKEPSGIKTKVWASHEVNEIIFVWYHSESIEPDWWPQPLKEVKSKEFIFQGRNEFLVTSHVQDVTENGSDSAHLDIIHVSSMFTNKLLSSIMKHSWTYKGWSAVEKFTQHYETEEEKKRLREEFKYNKYKSNMSLCHKLVLFNKIPTLELNVVGDQMGPGYVELSVNSSIGTVWVTLTVTPIQPMLQKVVHAFYSKRLISPYTKFLIYGENLQFQRDVDIWNNKMYIANPVYTKDDRYVKAYRKWYSQFYSENSPTYESYKNSLEW